MKNEKQKLIIIVAAVCALSVCLYLCSGEQSSLIPQSQIETDSGDGATQYFLIDIVTDDVKISNYELEVRPVEYTNDELEELIISNCDYIYSHLLNGNSGFDNINCDLYFFSMLDKLPFIFEWNVEDESLISDTGEILCTDEFETNIYFTASYMSFSYDFSESVHVYPGELIKQKLKEIELENYINNSISKNAMDRDSKLSILQLPGSMDGKTITYYYSGTKKNMLYLLLGPLASILIVCGYKFDKEKDQKEKVQKILSEYPGMVQKMSLYLVSGMTIRNIWLKLCEESERDSKRQNPLYTEMIISANELNSGVSESLVYLRFGERIKNTEIVRFSALLSQNLKKGSSRLSDILNEEAGNAFEQRKQRAVKRGEEAGTKLLFPMMLLLFDVLVMIMIPAFWNI